MTDGLIDTLRIDQSLFPGDMSHAHNGALNAVCDLLRSDEAREAATRAAAQAQREAVVPTLSDAIDAVIRVLTGGDDE